jgi:hypothetical protein
MIFNSHISETLSAIGAVSISSMGRLRWDGVPVRACATNAPGMRSLLVDQLSALLYSQFYCYGRVVPLPLSNGNSREALATSRFVDRLVDSNQAGENWEGAWHVVSKEGDSLQVERGGLCMLVGRGAWRLDSGAHRAQVRFPSGSFSLSPGFYLVTPNLALTEADLVRLYWNTSAAGAVDLVRAVTTFMERASIPYQLKVLTDLSQYDRSDSGVLYLQQKDFPQITDLLRRVYRSIKQHIRFEVPIYTQQIAPGLGVAEQPPGGESFGRHRCRLLAEGIILASEAGLRSSTERLSRVRDLFTSHGLSFDRPHLNSGSDREYSIRIKSVSRRTCARSVTSLNRDAFLELAARIGHDLVRTAIWYRGSCNWVGDLTSPRRSFGALGPELYSGTSGIAWFLAELFRATGKEEFRLTAEGAIRQACDSSDTDESMLGKGLYAGWTGIAYAAWRCSNLLDRPALRRRSRKALARLARVADDPVTVDIISGEAGAILALSELGDVSSLRLAERYGRVLVQSAKRYQGRWSWKTINPPGYLHLTGFSHGTAGIASAFLVLYAKTKRSEFRDAAEGALRYERSCFNEGERNWPDFREVRSRSQPSRCGSAWCHGAPGIALSRALAVSLLESTDEPEAELAAALEITRAALGEAFTPDSDFCLCHGLAGNADILYLVGHESDRDRVHQVGLFGIEQYGRGGWPRGVVTERLPGLMMGMAGIGHFYLRLYDSRIPSPLWIGPTLKPINKYKSVH